MVNGVVVALVAMVMVVVTMSSVGVSARKTSGELSATVFYDDRTQSFELKFDVIDKYGGVAFGTYNDTIETTGWGVLHLETNPSYPDPIQAYAAGYLEGALTQPRIYEMYENLLEYFFPNETAVPDDIQSWFMSQDAWMRSMIGSNPDSTYWQAVNLILSQYDGLVAGYSKHSNGESLDISAFQLLNGCGDVLDLIPAINETKRTEWHNLTPKEFKRKVSLAGHCSVLIKLTGDYSDLFMGHSAWFTYSSMLRIFKYYNLRFTSSFAASHQIAFSSYPGFLESLDDFYMMDSNLVMLQTTNVIFNQSLYDVVTPNSLLAWHRVRVANLLANSGETWANAVSQYNSGTYNNQYMIVDTKEFTPGQPLGPNVLWVVEQIPGLVESADVSDHLERGYWPSYNVAFFPTIYNLSGYPEMVELYGVDSSYQLAPRAQIFRRDQGNVVDFESYQYIMRYNDYPSDPYARGDPDFAICSRYDFGADAIPAGCIDTKVTNYNRSLSLLAEAVSGPTTQDGVFPPFSWANFPEDPHFGEPEVYDFGFVSMAPKTFY